MLAIRWPVESSPADRARSTFQVGVQRTNPSGTTQRKPIWILLVLGVDSRLATDTGSAHHAEAVGPSGSG